jgi:pantoate--beta-alanine ligase
MRIATDIAALRALLRTARTDGARIAFVPTMGNLHAGHQALFTRAHQHAEVAVASVYVNPLQFGADDDFEAYPRTPEQDRAVLEAAGVDILFAPDDAQIYPRGRAAHTWVEVPGLSDQLCGRFRPGHFRGVTTVVARLFNLVAPDVALFGKKDYQQCLLIRLMVGDLGLPIKVIGVDTVREPDGLALSSRNRYLTADERRRAPRLYATLADLASQIRQPGAAIPALEARALQVLRDAGFRPDYASVRRQADLAPPTADDRALVILAAAWLGRARLIDNLEVNLNPSS